MRSSVFGKWVLSRPFKAHVVLPAVLGFTLVAMYFSTIPVMQGLVAPGTGGHSPFSFAGRGALELLQVVLLLGVFFFCGRGLLASREWPVRLWALLLLLGGAAVFMEEVDFGTSLVSLLSGQGLSADLARAGDAQLAGEAVAAYVKLALSAFVGLFFVIAPVVLHNTRNRTLRLIAPSTWSIATVLLALALNRFAHFLQDAGLGIIAGVQGPLVYDIAEFHELLVYYLVLVYVALLHERIIARQ